MLVWCSVSGLDWTGLVWCDVSLVRYFSPRLEWGHPPPVISVTSSCLQLPGWSQAVPSLATVRPVFAGIEKIKLSVNININRSEPRNEGIVNCLPWDNLSPAQHTGWLWVANNIDPPSLTSPRYWTLCKLDRQGEIWNVNTTLYKIIWRYLSIR